MLAGAEFPPIDIFKVKERFVVADGHHRLIAAVNAKIDKIPCVIHEGGLRDVVLFSVGANAEHGRRRSPGDMRRVVEKLLTDKVWSQWNDTAIAARCHVSHSYVSKIRNQSSFHGGKMTAERKVTRKGITELKSVMPRSSRSWPLTALMLSGVSCTVEDRFDAVTTISSSCVPEAGAVACCAEATPQRLRPSAVDSPSRAKRIPLLPIGLYRSIVSPIDKYA